MAREWPFAFESFLTALGEGGRAFFRDVIPIQVA
jgi:hypothetical protein